MAAAREADRAGIVDQNNRPKNSQLGRRAKIAPMSFPTDLGGKPHSLRSLMLDHSFSDN
jgi:hypothetical protein